jgi:nucleotide-binding universal stress UspA family protein
MVTKILLATDGSEHAQDAAQLLARLPLAAGTQIHVVSVVDPGIEARLDGEPAEHRKQVLAITETTAATLRREGVEATATVLAGDADHQLILAADDWKVDLLVIGSRGLTGLAAFVLGSVARNVAKHAHCSVLIARAPEHGFRRVLLALDGSTHAAQAAELAGQLPLPPETTIDLIHVVRPPRPALSADYFADGYLAEALVEGEREQQAWGEEMLGSVRQKLGASGCETSAEVRRGDPATEILALAEEQGTDLIVAGAKGESLIEHLLTGSVADRLLKKAACSVLLVR